MAVRWLIPSTVITTEFNAERFRPEYGFSSHHLTYLAVTAVIVSLILLVCSALKCPHYLRFFILLFFFPAAVTLGSYWLGVNLLAEPHRFHLAMEMGFVLTLMFLTRALFTHWPKWRTPAAIVFAAFCIFQFIQYRGFAQRLIHPIDITRTSEYKTARWFDEHMRDSRVEAPGSDCFWLNAFTDTPQLIGCCLQSVLSNMIPVANFGITSDLNVGDRAFENSLLWFKALGVRAAAVAGRKSTEVFKTFVHPHKFDGRFRYSGAMVTT